MISKTKLVWKECASNLFEIQKSMKAFPDRLHRVQECNRYPHQNALWITFFHIFNTLFCHSFYNINNLQFSISLDMFYCLDFSYFSKVAFLTSVSFFINMFKLSIGKLALVLDFLCKILKFVFIY